MLLIDRILRSVERDPGAPAFIGNARAISYRQLLALLSATLQVLVGKGVRPGDTVGVKMGQSVSHVVVLLALARLGAVSLPVFPSVRAAEQPGLLARFGVRMLVCESAEEAREGVAVIHLADVRARGDETRLDYLPFLPAADTPMRIGLTSGTTEVQKGFLMTHGSFVRRLDRRFYGDAPRARVIPPLLHITASLQLACHALCAGGSVVFPRSNELDDFFATIRTNAVTHVAVPPANLAAWVALFPDAGPAFPSITHLRIVGLTPSPALVELVRRRITPNAFATYSTSETGVVALATPEILAGVPGSAGRVTPGARLEVVDAEGAPLPAGTSGEIRVATDGMPGGYCGVDADAGGFRDGWFYPRDRGHVSADGLVFIAGRIDEILNVGGRKIAPEYLEALLLEHPRVRDAAVFALEEGLGGVRLAAAIVPEGGLQWGALADYARARFDVFTPVRYFKVSELPRNAMGKLRRRELAAWAASHGEIASA